MKIHLQSDTHIEGGASMVPSCASDVAICAGDIGLIAKPGQLTEYFNQMKDCAEYVIWVMGNHEFYHSEYNEALDKADALANKLGIHLLDEVYNRTEVEIDGVTFWGSTLWTDLKDNDWFVTRKVGNGFNDFHVVRNGDRNFSFADTVEINKRTREKINWDADVIISHHCPIVVEHRRFPIDDITYGFCNTGLEEQIAASNVKYWLYGHSHDSRCTDVNGTLVLSNQHGYARPSWEIGGDAMYEDCGFDPNLILEI